MNNSLTRWWRLSLAFSLAIITAGSLYAGTNVAMDKNVVEPAPLEAPCFDWSGFYLGLHAGYGWGDAETSSDDFGFGTDEPRESSESVDPEGFVGGGQLGYNWQFNSFVLGLQAQGGWLDMSEDKFIVDDPDNFVTADYNWYVLLTPRVGFAWNCILFYAKGGAAFVDVENSGGDLDGRRIDGDRHGRSDDTEVSWAVGGGLEAAIHRNWTIKVEYDYVDIDDTGSESSGGQNYRHENDLQMITAGVNFHFGPGR